MSFGLLEGLLEEAHIEQHNHEWRSSGASAARHHNSRLPLPSLLHLCNALALSAARVENRTLVSKVHVITLWCHVFLSWVPVLASSIQVLVDSGVLPCLITRMVWLCGSNSLFLWVGGICALNTWTNGRRQTTSDTSPSCGSDTTGGCDTRKGARTRPFSSLIKRYTEYKREE